MTVIPNRGWSLGTVPKRLEKSLDKERSDEQSRLSNTVKTIQSTQKNSGDMKRIAVTQTPVKDYLFKIL